MCKRGLLLQALHVAGRALPSGDAAEQGLAGFLARGGAGGWSVGNCHGRGWTGRGSQDQVLVLEEVAPLAEAAALRAGGRLVSYISPTQQEPCF